MVAAGHKPQVEGPAEEYLKMTSRSGLMEGDGRKRRDLKVQAHSQAYAYGRVCRHTCTRDRLLLS